MTNAARPRANAPGLTRWVAGLAGAALVVACGYAFLAWLFPSPTVPPTKPANPPPRTTQPDSTLTVSSPYLNTAPNAQYVGDDVCARCHRSHAETYRRHPMGRSLTPIADTSAQPDHLRQAGTPFDALGLQFRVERRGNQVVHKETAYDANRRPLTETEDVVSYAIGSGTHAYSYLIKHDGVLTQSPITWFTRKNAWDISPGYTTNLDRFERPILAGCLFCHSNRADLEPDTLNTYRDPIFHGHAIGCERCHGPGALHAQARENFREVEDPDLTIVNPGRLSPALRESVCEQCHLGGQQRVVRRGREAYDFRPGLPWESFVRVFVTPPEATQGNRVAGHVEQMHASRCFQQSAGRLGCVSCHDPHMLPGPEEKETYYRDRCLQCHESKGCTVPLTKRRETTRADDCTVCHMAAEDTNVRHVALTDHRIPRRPEARRATTAEPAAHGAARFLVPFGRPTVDLNDPEMARDWAVALIGQGRVHPDAFRAEAGRVCLPVLEPAARLHPDDLSAGECLALAWAWLGQFEQALAECDKVLARAPRRELALSDAGVVTQRMGAMDLSLGYWQRALAVNPWSSRYRFEVAQIVGVQGDPETAVRECKRVLAQNGGHVNSRFYLMRYYLQNGMRVQARTELETILALHPANAAQLRETYADLLR
jgi:hypothetical protein